MLLIHNFVLLVIYLSYYLCVSVVIVYAIVNDAAFLLEGYLGMLQSTYMYQSNSTKA